MFGNSLGQLLMGSPGSRDEEKPVMGGGAKSMASPLMGIIPLLLGMGQSGSGGGMAAPAPMQPAPTPGGGGGDLYGLARGAPAGQRGTF